MQTALQRHTVKVRWTLPNVMGLGGVVAGLLAGSIMIVVSPILSWLTNINVWEPPKLIAATVSGSTGLTTPGFILLPVLIGTLVHLVTSVVLGTIFGLVCNRVLHLTTDFGLPIYIGLLYGMLIFFVSYFLLLPSLNPMMHAANMAPLIAQNLVFGVGVGLFYMLVRPQPYNHRS